MDIQEVKALIPSQKFEKPKVAGAAAAEAAGAATEAATLVALGVNISLSGAMAQVWGMINGMQIFINLPLFQVEFPELSFSMIDSIINIATFDVFPWTEDIFALFLTPPESELEDEKF